MDVDASRILEGGGTLAEAGAEIFDLVRQVAAGHPTKSEALGPQEFILGDKSFEPLGPSCLLYKRRHLGRGPLSRRQGASKRRLTFG
jgi:hypothetical protein